MEDRQRSVPVVSTEHAAFFFDVDGTLAALQAAPELVSIPGHVRKDLQQLYHKTSGAVAVVSGRPLMQIDLLLAPLTLPAAGIHGAERRDNHGRYTRVSVDPETLSDIEQQLETGIAQLPGVVLEKKRIAFALHYRQARQFSHQTRELAQAIAKQFPALVLQPGKCVVELKPASIDKGVAINAFMQQPPFYGRVPVFLGDDLTDERGFLAVNQRKGISVKIGEGKTHAQYRLNSTHDVYAWIKQLLTPGIQQSVVRRSLEDGTISRSF